MVLQAPGTWSAVTLVVVGRDAATMTIFAL